MNQLMSRQIDQLATALAKAQGEMQPAYKNCKNSFFKSSYADFESVVASSRPYLSKHGLSVVQSPFRDGQGKSVLISTLLHNSGQWITSIAEHNPQKNDIQSLSSYNTYLKRMCYSSLVGIVTGDVDDDGEFAVAPTRNNNPTINTTNNPIISEFIDADQIAQIKLQLEGFPETTESVTNGVKKEYGEEGFEKIPKSQFYRHLNRIIFLTSQEKEKQEKIR